MLSVKVYCLEKSNKFESFGFTVSTSNKRPLPEINEIKPNSHAQDVGLKTGDIVLAVDGVNVASASEVYELCREKLTIKIMVERIEGDDTNSHDIQPHSVAKHVRFDLKATEIVFNKNFESVTTYAGCRLENQANGRFHNYQSSATSNIENTLSSVFGPETSSSSTKTKKTSVDEYQSIFSDKNASENDYSTKSKKTLAAILGQPEEHVSFSHHNAKTENSGQNEDDEDHPTYSYRSILDVCPEGNMLLAAAGRSMFSADLRD